MSDEIKSLVEKGNALIETMRADLDATKASDALSKDKLAKMETELASVLAEKNAAEQKAAAIADRLTKIETAMNRPGATKSAEQVDEIKAAFVDYLREPRNEAKAAAYKALQTKAGVTLADGGYMAVPSVISGDIATIMQDISPFRSVARVVTVGTTEYSELLSDNTAGIEWVGETDDRNETAAPKLVTIKPKFGEIAAKVYISLQALEDMQFNAQAWVETALGEKFAAGEADAFLNGNGINKPQGLFSAATAGNGNIVKSGVADALTADNLVNLAISGLKAGYRENASWYMSSATLAKIATLKDKDDNYILKAGLEAATPLTIMGKPVTLDDLAMPTYAAGNMPVIFGDFQKAYLIADRVGVNILPDPYSKDGYLTIKARKRVGGTFKDVNAVRFLKLSV